MTDVASLMWEWGIWGQKIDPDFEFLKDKKYLRLDGKVVTIIRGRAGNTGYECVQGDDGEDMAPHSADGFFASDLGFRYNRTGTQEGLGRCTGSKWNDPHNLIPIYFPYLNGEA